MLSITEVNAHRLYFVYNIVSSNHQILNSVYSLTKLSSNWFKVYANEICEPEFSAFLIQGERDQAAAA